jgi:CBS domain containing-hemolysin-like protein
MLADLSILLVLFAVNGVFAMAEMALVGARRVRLQQRAAGWPIGSRGRGCGSRSSTWTATAWTG